MAGHWYDPKDADRKEIEDWIVSRGGSNFLAIVGAIVAVVLVITFIVGLF